MHGNSPTFVCKAFKVNNFTSNLKFLTVHCHKVLQ